MTIPIYQIDAFTNKLFGGNPAAVCPLDHWLDDQLLQKIATENNLAATAFYVQKEKEFHIRWFTPSAEVDLCGHATLAAANVLFNIKNYNKESIVFDSRGGKLQVTKQQELLTLNFPVDDAKEIALSVKLKKLFNLTPIKAFKRKTKYMLVFKNEQQINMLQPDLEAISKEAEGGVIVTAKSDLVDFVSRFFVRVNEDHVTGSAHTILIPYWAKQLNKNKLHAYQVSPRKGELWCELVEDRVLISGKAVTYLQGEIII